MKTRFVLPINISISHRCLRNFLFSMVVMFGVSTTAWSAPVLVTSGGSLIGINGVEVDGYGKWDLTLHQDFTGVLYSEEFSKEASLALLGMFTLDGVFSGTIYDNEASSSLWGPGCSTSIIGCSVLTAHTYAPGWGPNTYVGWAFVNLWDIDQPAYEDGLLEDLGFYYTAESGSVIFTDAMHADWTPSAVPIPAALFMFAPALLGFLGFRRKRLA